MRFVACRRRVSVDDRLMDKSVSTGCEDCRFVDMTRTSLWIGKDSPIIRFMPDEWFRIDYEVSLIVEALDSVSDYRVIGGKPEHKVA